MGLSSAYYLQQNGYKVRVLESGDGTDGCSYGNAGYVSPSHFIPLASPGIVAKGLRWMTSSESPFYIKPRFDMSLAKWGIQFMRNATTEHVNNSKKLLADFAVLSRELHQEFADEHKVPLDQNGIVMLCNTQKTLDHEIEIADMATELGLETRILDNQGLQELDPNVQHGALGGVFFPYDAFTDPGVFMAAMTRALKDAGVSIEYGAEVSDFVTGNGRVSKVISSKGEFEADEVVVATGSFTPPLLKKLKINLLMEAGKGYSVDWHDPVAMPDKSYILVEARVAITPLKDKIRFAGTMELGGINEKINPNRVAGFLKSIEPYFPQFAYERTQYLKPWAGLRPCSPDGLPFIGRNGKFSNLTIATGHAMLGFTLGPATGKVVAEIIEGKNTSIDISKLAIDRF